MEWRIPARNNINALLLVAHPDDETIFCGGTMFFYSQWSWTVICMTWKKNTTRYVQFDQAMRHTRALGVNIVSFDSLEQIDEGQKLTDDVIEEWKHSIQSKNLSPDIVFTHNEAGEYGHTHHKSLNIIANDLFTNVWEFICPGAINVAPQPYKDNINVVPLSAHILNQKTEVFNGFYKSELPIWKEMSHLMVYEFKTGPEIFTSALNVI